MTTTANKHGLRAAAAARREKHAQRNPQPSRHTTAVINAHVQSAQDSETAMERALDGTAYARMTVAELRARLDALTGGKAASRLTKAQLIGYILEAESAKAKAEAESAEIIEALDRGDEPTLPEGAHGHEAEPKGHAKAARIINALRSYGWGMEVQSGPAGRTIAILTRRSETLTVVWDSGVFNYDETAHAVGDRVVKVRNVSAAIKMGSRPAAEAEKDLERVVRNRTFNKAKVREAGEPVRRKLPFDAETVTEAELNAILAGKTLEWTNRITRGTETATVTDRSAKFFKITDGPAGRTLHFVSKEEGFKACRLADIIRVGGSRRKSAQGREEVALAA